MGYIPEKIHDWEWERRRDAKIVIEPNTRENNKTLFSFSISILSFTINLEIKL